MTVDPLKLPPASSSTPPEKPSSTTDGSKTGENPSKTATMVDQSKPSEEDLQLIETLNMLIDRLSDVDDSLHRPALEALRTQIRTSTASMTSIPKAIKYLRPHYGRLTKIYDGYSTERSNRQLLADIISILAMTMGPSVDVEGTETHSLDTLKYRLAGQLEPVDVWGHEYVRHLAMEVGLAYQELQGDGAKTMFFTLEDLIKTATELAVFLLGHNAEADACDLLYEIEKADILVEIAGDRFDRVCLYLQSLVPFELDEGADLLRVAFKLYVKSGEFAHALSIALRLGNEEMIAQCFKGCTDEQIVSQLAFIVARQGIPVPEDIGNNDRLKEISLNSHVSKHFHQLAKELEIEEAKAPEDIYKSHLQDTLRVVAPSARNNLAATFVNGFVNAGFGRDGLKLSGAEEEEGGMKEKKVEGGDVSGSGSGSTSSWVYRNKDGGLTVASASIGLINLWSPDEGLSRLDPYLYVENPLVKAGAILGIGLLHAGSVRNEADPAFALLREFLEEEQAKEKGEHSIVLSALMGLGIAYSGSCRQDIAEVLIPFVGHGNILVGSIAAIALGQVFVGSGDGDIASAILQTLLERSEEDIKEAPSRLFGLALGLIFLQRSGPEIEIVLETLDAVEHEVIREGAKLIVKSCSCAANGNVLNVQQLLQLCAGEEKEYLSYAVLGIALIAGLGDDIGREMSLRLFTQLAHLGSLAVRQAIPLALALMYPSNPYLPIIDMLGKLSHDHEKAVAVNAILAMGLVCAGTNNAKMAQMLRHLAAYYQKDTDCLFMVRIAQGLVHLGKGTITISPLHLHRSVIDRNALAGLLSLCFVFTNAPLLLLEGPYATPSLIYLLTLAMHPRHLITLEADTLKPVPVLVRVGQAVETVGQAGRPKTITGFQTHTTPVLLGAGERAELGTDEWVPLTPILENVVLVRSNPNKTSVMLN